MSNSLSCYAWQALLCLVFPKAKVALENVVPLYSVSKTDRRDGTYGLFRRLGRLIQTFPLPCKGLSEHVIETIRIARRDYLNDPKVRGTDRPKALIVGHHDLNPQKDCPCIKDVVHEYADLQPR